jgi:hypothetical protein
MALKLQVELKTVPDRGLRKFCALDSEGFFSGAIDAYAELARATTRPVLSNRDSDSVAAMAHRHLSNPVRHVQSPTTGL